MSSDVETLDQLISDDLVFTNHLGQRMSKADDLEAHRSGIVQINSIECSERDVQDLGSFTVVNVVMNIDGTFGGEPGSGAFRFTRVWKDGQIVAAHSSLVV